MSDCADVAADILEQHLAVSLANHQAKQPVISSEYCEDCGSEIPAARTAAVKTTRCVDCQSIFEAKTWSGYRSHVARGA